MKLLQCTCFILMIASPLNAKAAAMDELESYMAFLSKRDAIIAQNIANANTPGYIPIDVEGQSNTSSDLMITNSGHINDDTQSGGYTVKEAEVKDHKPNGNQVSLETELLKKAQNSMELQQSLALYNKMRGMLNAATAEK